MGYWAEVRNDFFESGTEIRQEDGDILAKISIDAWKTIDDMEDGRVIACVILSKHGDVLVDYRDNVARIDEMAQGAIKEAKDELRQYFKEQSHEFSESEKAAGQVYCLCEEFEDSDAIREFQILAVSADKDGLRKLMDAKIKSDEHGMIANNGVDTHDEDHFMTEFDCGFVAYYIQDQKVLSKDELVRMVLNEIGDGVFESNSLESAIENAEHLKEKKAFSNDEVAVKNDEEMSR